MHFVECGLRYLGTEVERLVGASPCDSSGAEFENDIFSMKAFCWCDGDIKGHEEGCPPNFLHKKTGFCVEWYKYLGRSTEHSEISQKEFRKIIAECLESLE
jgi:hypothetical protein